MFTEPPPQRPVDNEPLQERKIEIKQTFANEDWNDDYNDKESVAYQALETRLKTKILADLSNSNDFSLKEDSIRILSISEEPAASTNRRRKRSGTSKVKAEYEIIVTFSGNIQPAALKTAVANSLGVSEDDMTVRKVSVSGAGRLATSLGLILGALVMIYH